MTRTRRTVTGIVAVGLLVAACSDDGDGEDGDGGAVGTDGAASPATAGAGSTTPPSEPGGVTTSGGSGSPTTDSTGTSGSAPASGGGAVDLAEVCPDPLVIQTDWNPEAEHGGLYELLGEDYELDADAKIASGPLVAGGEETGITLELRAGGPAIGFQPVSVQQYADDSIHLGYANTEGQVLRWTDTPTISVVAPLEINPQIIYWDPETYPEVETLADLGESGATINIFEGGTFAEVFVGQGIWQEEQIDGSYDGTPGRFIAEDGAIAQQGFASAEPYTYENTFEDWGRPVNYQLLHDAGFEVYSQTLAVRPDALEELSPCLEAFVPIVQQAQVDYVGAPDRADDIIIDAVEQYDTGWVYDKGLAEYSVATQLELGLVGNGPNETLGDMEEARIQGVIDQIRDDAGLNIPDDLVASDLFTNEFVDSSIGL